MIRRWLKKLNQFLRWQPPELDIIERSFSTSPSGNHKLRFFRRKDPPGKRTFTAHVQTKNSVHTITGDHPSFPSLWIESHPSGRDYFVYSEHPGNISVLQLPTQRPRRSYLETNYCVGFSPMQFSVTSCKTRLVVGGCVSHGPLDIKIFDFSQPGDRLDELAEILDVDDYEISDDDTLKVEQRTLLKENGEALIEEDYYSNPPPSTKSELVTKNYTKNGELLD